MIFRLSDRLFGPSESRQGSSPVKPGRMRAGRDFGKQSAFSVYGGTPAVRPEGHPSQKISAETGLTTDRFAKSGAKGQLTAMLIVLFAVMLLLVLFLINVGQVTVTKTSTANAADAASLAAASSLGTIARSMALQLGKGKKYKRKKCKTNWLNIFMIVIIVVIIAVTCVVAACSGAAFLSLFTGGLAVGATGATAALAMVGAGLLYGSAITLGLQAGVFDPATAHRFNRQFSKLKNVKDQIRENSIMTAFLRSVDDPNKVVDARDINENCKVNPPPPGDPCVTEEISAFSDWYDRRLEQLVNASQAQVPATEAAINNTMTRLRNLKGDLQTLRSRLDSPIIPILGWIEELGRNVTFWMPGDQLSDPNEPNNCSDTAPTCGPGCAGAQDQVDCLKVRLSDAIAAIDAFTSVDPSLLGGDAGTMKDLIEGLIADIRSWDPMLAAWVNELNTHKAMIFWPPVFTINCAPPPVPGDPFPAGCKVQWPSQQIQCSVGDASLCSITSMNPSILPPVAPADPLKHPVQWIIEMLNEARRAIQGIGSVPNLSVPAVSVDDPVYSWQDNRGWHHVQVKISNFKIPKMKASSGFFKSCVRVKHAKQKVTVSIARYDEDNFISQGWTMRYRDDAAGAPHYPPSDPRNVNYGVVSTSTAYHQYFPNSVKLIKAK